MTGFDNSRLLCEVVGPRKLANTRPGEAEKIMGWSKKKKAKKAAAEAREALDALQPVIEEEVIEDATIEQEPYDPDCLPNIGRSLHITGELTGNEDISIDGTVEGKIFVKDHHLTIGKTGHIKADIHARSLVIMGEVIGNIQADERVEVSATGVLHGDINSPQVVLEQGCRFKGKIDMGADSDAPSKANSKTAAKAASKPTVKAAANNEAAALSAVFDDALETAGDQSAPTKEDEQTLANALGSFDLD